jgi:mannose-6-phosphate isomerase-like protein (cupin superfamily)
MDQAYNHTNYYWAQVPARYPDNHKEYIDLRDYGPEPFVVNIEDAAEQNRTFRTALWTGNHLQLTLMSINVGEDIGLEVHPNTDQFLRIEEGYGLVMMGDNRDNLYYQRRVCGNYGIFVPAGTWHNLINIGSKPIKLYSIYAPPAHPHGTIHKTKEDEEHHEY